MSRSPLFAITAALTAGACDARGEPSRASAWAEDTITCPKGIRADIMALPRANGEAWDTFGRSDAAEPDLAGTLVLRGEFGTLRENLRKRRDQLEVSSSFFAGKSIVIRGSTQLDLELWDVDLRYNDHVARIQGSALDFFKHAHTVAPNGQAAVRLACLQESSGE